MGAGLEIWFLVASLSEPHWLYLNLTWWRAFPVLGAVTNLHLSGTQGFLYKFENPSSLTPILWV